MLRITEVRLPLDHPEAALRAAPLERLGIAPDALVAFSVFRRGVDARKRPVTFTYTLDAEVRDEAALLARLKNDRRVSLTPDMSYRPVARAPSGSGSSGGGESRSRSGGQSSGRAVPRGGRG